MSIETKPEANNETGKNPASGTTLKEKFFAASGKSEVIKGRPSNASKEAAEAEKKKREVLEEMLSEDVLNELVSVYPDFRFAMTGSTCFEMDERTKTMLGALAKPLTKLIDVDPGYLALILFAGFYGKTIINMETAYATEKRELKKLNNTKEEKK